MSVLGYFPAQHKIFVPDVQQVILVLLSGIWVCGLSSLYPLVNLGKLHPLLNLFPRAWRNHTTAAPKPSWLLTHGYLMRRNLVASRSHLQDSLGSRRTEILSTLINWHSRTLHLTLSSSTIECTDDHESNSGFIPANLIRNYQCTTKIHTVKEGMRTVTSRHCGVAKGSQSSAWSLEVMIV